MSSLYNRCSFSRFCDPLEALNLEAKVSAIYDQWVGVPQEKGIKRVGLVHTHISFTFVLQVMEKAVGGVASWVYDLFAANGYNHGKKLFKVGHQQL